MSEEYDLKQSEKNVGQMLPVIKDAHGKIVDGLHRKEVDPNWKEEVRSDIKTVEDYWKARAHLNFSRRNAQDAKAEKIEIINCLAGYYQKQGKAVSGVKQPTSKYNSTPQNEVLDAVINALSGAISESWIRQNISDTFLQVQERKPIIEIPEPESKVEKTILGHYATKDKPRAVELITELKQNVKETLLESPEFAEEFEERQKAKIEEKIAELPTIEDQKAVEKEAEVFRLTKPEIIKRVEEIKQARESGKEPLPATRAIIVTGEWFMNGLRNPIEKLLMLNIRGVQELSNEQRNQAKQLLTSLRIKISQIIEALQ